MKLMPVLYRHGVERFRDPEDRIRYLQRVREEIEGGRLSGVRSAPGIFIDGRRHDVSFELGSLADAVGAVLRD